MKAPNKAWFWFLLYSLAVLLVRPRCIKSLISVQLGSCQHSSVTFLNMPADDELGTFKMFHISAKAARELHAGPSLLGLHHICSYLKRYFPAVSSCSPASGVLLVYFPSRPPPPPPPPAFYSSHQPWQASLHSGFQSRPVLHQMLRGNIKRSAGQSLPGIPACLGG